MSRTPITKPEAMAELNIDIDYVAKLAELLQRTGLTEIEIGQGEIKIRVAKQIQQVIDVHGPTAMVSQPAAPVITAAAAQAAEAAADLSHAGLVKSPMVGTAYLAAEPGSPPFVSVGQDVREGATLLIIEAMKVMNSIRAPKSGRVTKVFIDNAAPVEYGEPLLIIE